MDKTNTLPDQNKSLVSIVLCREANLRRASPTIEEVGDNSCTVLVCGNQRPASLRTARGL
jgi:hypothetical protein